MSLDTVAMAGSRCPGPSMPLSPQQLVHDAQRWYLCGQNFHYFSHNYQPSPALQHTLGRSRSENAHRTAFTASAGKLSLLPPSGTAPHPTPGAGAPSPSPWSCGSSNQCNPSTTAVNNTTSRATVQLPCTHPVSSQRDAYAPAAAFCGLGNAGTQHTAPCQPWATPQARPGHLRAGCDEGRTSAAGEGAAALARSRYKAALCTAPVSPWATAQRCPEPPGCRAGCGEDSTATGSRGYTSQAKRPTPIAVPTASANGVAQSSGHAAPTTSHSCQRAGAAIGGTLSGLPVHSSCNGASSTRSSIYSSNGSRSSVCDADGAAGGSQRSVSHTSESVLGSASGSDGEGISLPSSRSSLEATLHTCGCPHAYPSPAPASPAGSPAALSRPLPGGLTAAVVPLPGGSCPPCVQEAQRAGVESVPPGRGQPVTHLATPPAVSPGAIAEPIAGAAAAALAAGPAASREPSSPAEPGGPHWDSATCQSSSSCQSAYGGCTQAAAAPPDGGAECGGSLARTLAGGGTYGGRTAGHEGDGGEREEPGEPPGAQVPSGQPPATPVSPPLPTVRVPALPALDPHDAFVGAVVLQWCEEEGAAGSGRGLWGGDRGRPGSQEAAAEAAGRAGCGVERGEEGPLVAGEGLWGSVLHGWRGLQGMLAGAWGVDVGRAGVAAVGGSGNK